MKDKRIEARKREGRNRRRYQGENNVRYEIETYKEHNQVRPHSALSYKPPAPWAIIPVTLT